MDANLAALPPGELSVVLQYLPDPLLVIGEDRRLLGLNPAAEALTGLLAADVVGQRTCVETIACHDRQGNPLCAACPHVAAAAAHDTRSDAGIVVRDARGLAVPVTATYFPLPEPSAGPRVDALILCERTVRPGAAAGRAVADALDPATGLYARDRFESLYARERERAQRFHGGLGVIRVAVRPRAGSASPASLDAALGAVAALLRDDLRAVDLVGRCDAHDCAVLLPAASFATTRVVAARLERGLQALGQEGTIPATVQVQVGVAYSEGYDDLLARSGQRLSPLPPSS